MARGVIVLLAAGLVAAGCGSARHATYGAGPTYTLRQVKAAFAAKGIPLQKMLGPRGGHMIVLVDPEWSGPWGYQHVGGPPPVGVMPSVTRFLVIVSGGRHSTQSGNVSVEYGDAQRLTVSAALRHLTRTSAH